MIMETDPNLTPVANEPYSLPLKHQKFVKEEIENLLEAWLTDISMSPCAAPIIVVNRKSKPEALLAETETSNRLSWVK